MCNVRWTVVCGRKEMEYSRVPLQLVQVFHLIDMAGFCFAFHNSKCALSVLYFLPKWNLSVTYPASHGHTPRNIA